MQALPRLTCGGCCPVKGASTSPTKKDTPGWSVPNVNTKNVLYCLKKNKNHAFFFFFVFVFVLAAGSRRLSDARPRAISNIAILSD
jgi:hypothetical protein